MPAPITDGISPTYNISTLYVFCEEKNPKKYELYTLNKVMFTYLEIVFLVL